MKFSLLLLLFFVLQPWGMAQAAGPNMFFSGTLVMPPCTISKGAKVEVDFGEDLGVNKIDGVNYTKPVDYTVDCDEDYVANQLAIVIETTSPTIFDPSAVATDKNGLGIKVMIGTQPVTFAQPIAVDDPTSPPVISVAPVKDPAITLEEGAFEAFMTLRTDYI